MENGSTVCQLFEIKHLMRWHCHMYTETNWIHSKLSLCAVCQRNTRCLMNCIIIKFDDSTYGISSQMANGWKPYANICRGHCNWNRTLCTSFYYKVKANNCAKIVHLNFVNFETAFPICIILLNLSICTCLLCPVSNHAIISIFLQQQRPQLRVNDKC